MARGTPGEGKVVALPITDLNHDGEGVGRTEDGFVLFVPQALPGDVVEAEVREVKKGFGRARMRSLLEPSPGRIAAPCPVAGECGGCPLQHFDYARQLAWKEDRVLQALRRIGRFEEPPVAPILGMERPFQYRNKAQYPVRAGAGGRVEMGFYRQGSHELVPSEDCLIQHPLVVEAARAIRGLVEELRIAPYDEATGLGVLRHIVVRASFARKETMVVAVTSTPELPLRAEWVRRAPEAVGSLVSLVHNVQERRGNTVLGDRWELLWGEPCLVEVIGEKEFEISPGAFFQVNPVQAARLFEAVRAYAELRGSERVWDVYCGAGSIGLYLADGAAELRGVERVAQAVEDARRNARRNGIDQARFEVGEAERVLPRWVQEGGRADVCLLDPPRKGCDPRTLEAVLEARPGRVIYVSCNPTSLARDLRVLVDGGYQLIEVQPVDMFPHTAHVEAVACLRWSG